MFEKKKRISPSYNPLDGADPDFSWDGTKQPKKSVEDEYIYPRGVDKGFIWDGNKQKKKNDEKRHWDQKYDRPRFKKHMRSLRGKTESSFGDNDWHTAKKFDAQKKLNAKGFNRPRFSAGKSRDRFEDDLVPEWDNEDFENQNDGKYRRYFMFLKF